MFERRSFSGHGVPTTLTTTAQAADTTIFVGATTGWPNIATGPFYIGVDLGNPAEETMKVTAYTATTATVVRGADTTTAVVHQVGAGVYIVDTAQDADEANQLVHALLTGGTTGQVATVDTSLTPPIKLAALPAAGVSSFNGGTGAIAQANGYGIAGANANPPVPAVALTTVQAFLAADVTLSGATPTALANVTLAAGTWLVLGRASGENTQGVDAIDLWLSTAAGGAGPALAAAVINLMQIDNSWTPSFAAIVTPGTSTTYYLNIESGGTCTVKAAGTYIAPHVVTGLTAVRLA